MVIIIFGQPYTGRTYFASRLAKEIDAVYISSEQIRNQMFSFPTHSESEKERVYEHMRKLMKANVKMKENVVLDATFYKVEIRNEFLKETVSLTAETYFIEIKASEEIVQERMRRAGVISWEDMQRYEKVRHDFQHHTYPHLILESTDNNIDSMLGEALDYLPSHARHSMS